MRSLKMTPIQLERWFAKVEKSDGCWLWTGHCSSGARGDYGRVKINGELWSAHRASYAQFVAPIPDGLFVLHRCDVPRCVRPDHLFLGTHDDNMEDMRKKGRVVTPDRSGSANGNARLTDEKVREIIALLPTHNNKQIAALYGVSHHQISLIRRGKSWMHIERDVAKPYASLRRATDFTGVSNG